MDTIHPRAWDIPVDYVVTECGVYRRDPEGLVFLGMPKPGGSSEMASPVCYGDEHFSKASCTLTGFRGGT